MMDAFTVAGRVKAMLPPLPKGITSTYIHILDALHDLLLEKEQLRVSDLSDRLDLPRPGITKAVREMEEKGLIIKSRDTSDGRLVHLKLTDAGLSRYQVYTADYFASVSEKLSGISDEDARQMIRTIRRIHASMRGK